MYRIGDLTEEDYFSFDTFTEISVDCETTGLDPLKDELKVILVWDNAHDVGYYIKLTDAPTRYISTLLGSRDVYKYMHYAYFDMRFLAKRLNITIPNVLCTKIAAKILDPYRVQGSQSLGPLLARHLNITIEKNKDIQTGDWSKEPTADMLQYAQDDVQYLDRLLRALGNRMNTEQKSEYYKACKYLTVLVDQFVRFNGGLYSY
jgi:ribonuclease D